MKDLFVEAERFVKNLLHDHLPHTRFFHTIHHTEGVVAQCEALSSFYNVPEAEAENLILAAWFHDTGYCFTSTNHEAESCRIATEYLTARSIAPENISRVVQLILSTKLDYTPTTLLEKILHDADTHHLASDLYPVFAQRLKQELQHSDGIYFSDQEWNEQNIAFFKSHQFYTQRAQDLWNHNKQRRLQLLLQEH